MESRFALEPLEMGAAGVAVVGLHVELLEDAFISQAGNFQGRKEASGNVQAQAQ